MTAPSSPPAGQRSRISRRGAALFLLALAGAGVLAVLLGRRTVVPPSSGGHDHGAMAAAPSDSIRAIRLGAADARRIGVTFAEVTRAPLGQPVRAVAEVTYDETKVATVALKVDGWVERLHVNFTGQSVRRGAPLLDLYSPMLVTAQEELLLAHRLTGDVARGTPEARQDAGRLI
jgi:hypothetical protein